jgi:8-oxo-dGTP pyrophosphatase MutT (NUDIX family)
MTTTLFEPDPSDGEDRIPAANPGPGAPEPEPGYGIGAEDNKAPSPFLSRGQQGRVGSMAKRDHLKLEFAVDIAILTMRENRLQVLAIARKNAPYQGRKALPGGFLRAGEDLPEAAVRELKEETNLDGEALHLEQLSAYGAPDRDPRGRVAGKPSGQTPSGARHPVQLVQLEPVGHGPCRRPHLQHGSGDDARERVPARRQHRASTRLGRQRHGSGGARQGGPGRPRG